MCDFIEETAAKMVEKEMKKDGREMSQGKRSLFIKVVP